jgi:hypothetical protein
MLAHQLTEQTSFKRQLLFFNYWVNLLFITTGLTGDTMASPIYILHDVIIPSVAFVAKQS